VRRAEREGPGFLDYCPLHTGRARARFTVDVPGGALAPGWCRTSASRQKTRDVVIFKADWNARRVNGTAGTYRLTYTVPRSALPGATPVPTLTGQSGTLPP
jgi:hypothetical protein